MAAETSCFVLCSYLTYCSQLVEQVEMLTELAKKIGPAIMSFAILKLAVPSLGLVRMSFTSGFTKAAPAIAVVS